MKTTALFVSCWFMALIVGAVGLDKLPFGNEAVLRHYHATNVTEMSVNAYQLDESGGQVSLGTYPLEKRFKSYEAFEVAFRNHLRFATNKASARSRFNPDRPVLLYATASHVEFVRVDGVAQGVRVQNFFSRNLNGETIDEMNIQITLGTSIKFDGKDIVRVRTEVLDRKRFDLSYDGELFYLYADSNDGWNEFVSLGDKAHYKNAVLGRDLLLNGGPGGRWDVFIEFTLSDDSIVCFDGSGNQTASRRLFMYPDGFLEILGALPGEELLIQSTTNLATGEWYPEPEKAQTGNGQQIRRSLRRSTPPSSSYGEQKFFRILLQ